MNFDIRFDFQRIERLGLIEAIWGQDKSIDQLKRLSENVLSKNEIVFITRISSKKANELLAVRTPNSKTNSGLFERTIENNVSKCSSKSLSYFKTSCNIKSK